MNLTASHSLWAFLGIGLTCLAYGAGKWREGREERRNFTRLGKNTGKPEDDPVAAILSDLYRDELKLETHRLRLRSRAMGFSYADLKGDKPFVLTATDKPAAIAAPTINKYAAPAAAADPALTKRLQDMARMLGRERPSGITSADVIAALEAADPTTHERLQNRDRRLMGAVFTKDEWMQTGEWRATGSHSRPQRVWSLRAREAA